MPTIYIQDWNFLQYFSPHERERFWSLTHIVITRVLDSSFALDALRRAIEAAPVEEQIAFYHQDPIALAGRLLNVELTEGQMERYNQVLKTL